MQTLLILCALGFGLVGLLFLSNATSGVGMIGFGCLLAVLARVTQAQRYYDIEERERKARANVAQVS
jgi:hypothetical protein